MLSVVPRMSSMEFCRIGRKVLKGMTEKTKDNGNMKSSDRKSQGL